MKGKCFICLRIGHMIKDCKVEKPFFHFDQVKNHHRSFCPKKFVKEIRRQSSNWVLSYGEKVIMQTATVGASNSEARIPTIKTRILMDTGSQKTYVTYVRKSNTPDSQTMQLNTSARESYGVFTFGSSKPKQISTPLVAFDLKLNNGI